LRFFAAKLAASGDAGISLGRNRKLLRVEEPSTTKESPLSRDAGISAAGEEAWEAGGVIHMLREKVL
jgi:hypothetical protein